MESSKKVDNRSARAKCDMIFGLGVDLTSINRINQIFNKRGDRFLQKVLSPSEIKDFTTVSKYPKKSIEFLAGRYV
jgi:holo-[acyl-carrier-protein] synthase